MNQISSTTKIISYFDKMMQDDINEIMRNVIADMTRIIPQELPDVLKNSPKYKELINRESDIHTQVGVPDIEDRFEKIFKIMTNFTRESIEFEPCKIRDGKITSGYLEINLIPDDFREILESHLSEFTTNKGFNLPWFGWITTSEKSEYNPVISGYRISHSFPIYSRTGDAIMLRGNAFSWSLPPNYSGTTKNNWITEVIDTQRAYLEKIFLDITSKYGN